MYWTCLYGVHAKYVGFSCNISGFCLRGSHFEAQPQRLYSKLLFVVFLSTISPGTGESHCYFIIAFRFKNFLQLAADVASLNIVQILDAQVTVLGVLWVIDLRFRTSSVTQSVFAGERMYMSRLFDDCHLPITESNYALCEWWNM